VAVIEVEGLRKEYRRLRGGRTMALRGLDLSVPEGGVFGFLGPNGAGKTTTIRCLLGLVRATGGKHRLLGASTQAELARVLPKVGSMVETPAFFPTFSGRENLVLLGRLNGIGRDRVDAALTEVGLSERASSLFRTYSLGMKQRLGIAASLMKDPEVLILDEPANGLDPAGIKEVRELLRRLGREGRTVFVSSHLLTEVQQMCDRVAIISRGRLVTVGGVNEVLAKGGPSRMVVRVDDLDGGLAALQHAGLPARLEADHLLVDITPTEGARVSKALAERGLYVSELRPEEVSLEDVFLELTGEGESHPEALPPAPSSGLPDRPDA
jgi:ABC-2 type transport system ATP-binding protein